MIYDLSKIDESKVYGIKEIEKLFGIKPRTLKLYINRQGLIASKLQKEYHIAGYNLKKFLTGEGGISETFLEKKIMKDKFRIESSENLKEKRLQARRGTVKPLKARRALIIPDKQIK